jgi:hypothetical protein
MNVNVNEAGDVTSAVLYKINLEGDKIVQNRDCDVVIGKSDGTKPYMSFECVELAKVIVEALGVQVSSGKPDWFVSKRRNKGVWHDQTMIGVPLTTSMNQDLGIDMWSGCATRFIHESSYADWFKEPLVDEFFANHNGFVTYGMNDEGLTNVWFGVPFWGMMNVLEGMKEKITDYICGDSKLLESWCVSLAVSVHGYPEKKVVEAYHIGGVNPDLEKHFWPFQSKVIRKGLYSSSTMAGVVTAYHNYLNNAVSRAERTAWNLEIGNKQFRTDLFGYSSRMWRKLGLS